VAAHWTKSYPHIDIKLAPVSVAVERRANGEVILRSTLALPPYPKQIGLVLREQAARHPDRSFLAERDAAGGWRRLSYAEARRQADAVSQWLLDHGHSAQRPIAILSDNSINMALLKLGAMQVGIPAMPVSPAYSLMSGDFAKVKHIVASFDPSLIYVDRLAPFAKALGAIDRKGRAIVADLASNELGGVTGFGELVAAKPGPRVENAFATVGEDTVAKILLTSGSTGMPKGVVNTQRMMWASQAAVCTIWPFLYVRPPVLVDWLPWNHTFGANWNFNQVLITGGTMYIDGGKPLPGRIETTLQNLREVRPTVLYNVPRAYDLLLPHWEADEAFTKHLFGDLDCIFYAGAGMPQASWDRLEALAIKARGKRIPIFTALGSTETSPPATVAHWVSDVTGTVGLPMPGVEAKLVPAEGKTEIRFRGPNISPGYYKDPARTREAFDAEGFFKIGDAVKTLVPGKYESGMVFDGRVAENFKLLTGTWVAVGTLRLAVLSATSPIILDAAVTGADRDEVGLLAFANLAGCKAAIGAEAEALAPEAVVRHPRLHAALKAKLAAYNAQHPGSSERVRRVLLMVEPPNIDAGEITDKGYIGQRAVLARRAPLVERLYAGTGEDIVIA
jgi:feruloyl-CoA synthase